MCYRRFYWTLKIGQLNHQILSFVWYRLSD